MSHTEEGPITHPGIVPDLQKRIAELEAGFKSVVEEFRHYVAEDSDTAVWLDELSDKLNIPAAQSCPKGKQ